MGFNGRPSCQEMIKAFNSCNKFTPLSYKFFGEINTDNYGCFAQSFVNVTGQLLKGPRITIKLAKDQGWTQKSGMNWDSLPQQVLKNRAAAAFIKEYSTEIAIGFRKPTNSVEIKKCEQA